MTNPAIEQELYHHLALLSLPKQHQVLDFVRALSKIERRGVKGSTLLTFVGTIPVEELEMMQEAIEADCEKVDTGEW